MLKPKSRNNSGYGYSADTARRYVDGNDTLQFLDIPVRIQKKYDQKKREYIDEVDYYAYHFYIIGRGFMEIRFPQEIESLSPYSEVEIVGLLCWVNDKGIPYFKADDVEVIKEWSLVEAD